MQRLIYETNEDAITVETDVKNAFGSVSWPMLFRSVDAFSPVPFPVAGIPVGIGDRAISYEREACKS